MIPDLVARFTRRLPPSSQELQLQAKLIAMVFQQSAKSHATNYIVIALSAALLWSHVEHTPLLAWVIVSAIQTTIHIVFVRRYFKAAPPDSEALRWGWTFTAFTAVAGGLWGALGVLFFLPDDQFVIGFICIMIGSISAGSVAPLAAFKPAYYAIAFTIVLPFAACALLHGGTLLTVLGLLALLLLWNNLSNCQQVHKSMAESVMLRFENIDLVHKLEVEKASAEAANRAKTQFLAAASHDLRQPTHALGLFVATLDALNRRPALADQGIATVAERMRATLRNVDQLLDVLLDVSRLDAGVVRVEKQAVALQDVLAGLQNEFAGRAEEKGLQLLVPPCALAVRTDPIVLHSVLSNLVSNALRYTQEGQIRVDCHQRDEEVTIQVSDTGIGIAADQLGKIFEEFYQVGNVVRDREKGLGLGLAIVQRSVKLLDGQIDVQSTLGKGSVFSLRLAAGELPSTPVLPAGTLAAPLQGGKTVLLIDDDRNILYALRQLLEAWGHVALTTASMEEAVDAAAKQPQIDLILSDYRLSAHATGIDAIRAVRKVLQRQVEAIVITGDTSPARLQEIGASGLPVMHKPIDPQDLHRRLL